MKKRFSFWALMLAVALALSLVLTACGKKEDDNNDDGGNTGGGGTTSGGQIALVDASDLADKLFLMYTFEDADVSGKISAVNPYTGAAVESGATYGTSAALVTTPGTNVGGSKKAFDTAGALMLSNTFADTTFKEMEDDGSGYYVLNTSADEFTGVSVSFWAYNYETYSGVASGSEAADWSNVIDTTNLSITWGNISDKINNNDGTYGAIYPGNNATLGRAAYPTSMYQNAQGGLTQAQITASPNSLGNNGNGSDGQPVNKWWAFNAISGTLLGDAADDPADDTEAAQAMAEQYLQTWRYVTIDIHYETGISFYANGALAFRYTPEQLESFYVTGNKADWDAMYQEILLGLMKNGEGWSTFNLFNGVSGIYVDDLIIGQSLTATEAEHLYEDLASAATGTTVDVDTSITSTMQGSQEAQQEAEEKAMQNALAQAQADVESVSEQLKAMQTAGDITVGDSSETISIVMRKDYDNTSGWWSWGQNNVVTGAATDTGFEFSVTGYQISYGTQYYYGLTLGIWDESGSGGTHNTAFRPDAYIHSDDGYFGSGSYTYQYYENGSDTAVNLPTSWTAWSDALKCAKITMNLEYNSETHTFTVEWLISAVNAGKTYTGTATNAETGATVTKEYTVPEMSYQVICTATDVNVDGMALNGNSIRLYNDHSAYFVTEVTKGSLS